MSAGLITAEGGPASSSASAIASGTPSNRRIDNPIVGASATGELMMRAKTEAKQLDSHSDGHECRGVAFASERL